MPFLKSTIFFVKLIFIPVKVDFVLVSLNHFNRSYGKNDFLQPIKEDLKKSNKSFLYFEDTDLKGAYRKFPRSDEAIGFDFITFCLIALKKIGMSHKASIKVLRAVFFRNLDYKFLINMAGYTLSFFSEMFPTRMHFELQHGLIFNNREWWMLDDWNKFQNCGILLNGKGSKEILLSNKDYVSKESSKLLIIGGKDIKKNYFPNNQIKNILFTEQITIDNSSLEIKEYIDFFCTILMNNIDFIRSHNIFIYIKEHPRIPNSLNSRYSDFEFVIDINKLENNSLFAHLTFNSSSVFEYSLMGIPSIIIDGLSRRDPKFLLDTYKMPATDLLLNKNTSFKEIIQRLEDNNYFHNKSKEFESWSGQFFEDHNPEILTEIVKSKNFS